ncbi:hypothetical protein [Paraburkholderia sp.]|uniref:hypothetical protein n=1 Tax=Paraburkholderia sp. TaxID=1926495 RepID=UPI0025E35E2E|nr:hypothetical protein [Paraburkholderia sp.]
MTTATGNGEVNAWLGLRIRLNNLPLGRSARHDAYCLGEFMLRDLAVRDLEVRVKLRVHLRDAAGPLRFWQALDESIDRQAERFGLLASKHIPSIN